MNNIFNAIVAVAAWTFMAIMAVIILGLVFPGGLAVLFGLCALVIVMFSVYSTACAMFVRFR